MFKQICYLSLSSPFPLLDGVVLVDPDYVADRKVFGHILAAFRYGREDLDVLGLTFRKDLYLASEQIYPLLEESKKRARTRLQERLMKKLGTNAYPFFFEVFIIYFTIINFQSCFINTLSIFFAFSFHLIVQHL